MDKTSSSEHGNAIVLSYRTYPLGGIFSMNNNTDIKQIKHHSVYPTSLSNIQNTGDKGLK